MDEDAKTEALLIAAAYHRHWTSKRFDEAVALLDPELQVEVPINAYPTRESFGAALERFGSLVERVDLISELSGTGEAMLLYDMDVSGVGSLRVAEHFTVRRGSIVRLRQIHDTAPIRATGFGDHA
jgi:hypothetical protein